MMNVNYTTTPLLAPACRIFLEELPYLEDLTSTNGTFVNGEKMKTLPITTQPYSNRQHSTRG